MSRNYNLQGIEPVEVWHYFYEISQIPRAPGDKVRITDYLLDFCAQRGIEAYRDEAYNVVARMNATPGYEDVPGVILHSHVDMVCLKDEGVIHDFGKDPIRVYAQGDTVTAEGTTLGGDDGIGVAFMLAYMADRDAAHPSLECVFTTDEETDMNGGKALDYSRLSGKYYINIDGTGVAVGSAGELDVRILLPVGKLALPTHSKSCIIKVGGLIGGHSGAQAVLQRANAISLLGRVLLGVPSGLNLQIAAANGGRCGGNMATAISRTASAVVTVPEESYEALCRFILDKNNELKKEYAKRDPELFVSLEACAPPAEVLDGRSAKKLLLLLSFLPDGLISTHQFFEDTLGCCSNIGVLETRETQIELAVTIRSTDTRRHHLYEKLCLLCDELNVSRELICDFPQWDYSMSDGFMALVTKLYPEYLPYLLGGTGEIGFFTTNLPGLNAVSLTPTMVDCHSTNESLRISECKLFYERMVELIKQLRYIE